MFFDLCQSHLGVIKKKRAFFMIVMNKLDCFDENTLHEFHKCLYQSKFTYLQDKLYHVTSYELNLYMATFTLAKQQQQNNKHENLLLKCALLTAYQLRIFHLRIIPVFYYLRHIMHTK
jgi:hypothetical protein